VDLGSVLDWHPHPDVWLAVASLAGGYAWAVGTRGPRDDTSGSPAVSGKQMATYYAGVVLLWLAADWPLHDLAERSSFSVHMIQHLVLTFVVPPLLLLGVPTWLWRWLLKPIWAFRIVRFLTRPLVALILFNAAIAITHWPLLVNSSVESVPLHLAIHWTLVATALFMWWPVVAPLPELASLSEPAKMFYLFLQSILPTVPASFLTFASDPVYDVYVGMPHLFGMSTVMDQQISGLIMKIGGGLLLWSVIAFLFFKWHASEEAGGSEEEVTWEDFESELKAWDLRR
jgi:putative membrane protein